jgi:hypothetical protein
MSYKPDAKYFFAESAVNGSGFHVQGEQAVSNFKYNNLINGK